MNDHALEICKYNLLFCSWKSFALRHGTKEENEYF